MASNGLLINYQFCSGCQSCEIACRNEHDYPLEKLGVKVLQLGPAEMEPKKLEWEYIPTPTSYCDLCAERVSSGDIPTCVLHCLSGVMEYGPMDKLASRAEELGNKTVIFLP